MIYFLVVLISLLSTGCKESACDISGDAVLWAYDSCLFKHETDDTLDLAVTECVKAGQSLIKEKGECGAKRIFKTSICSQRSKINPDNPDTKTCMQNDIPLGPSVKDGGI